METSNTLVNPKMHQDRGADAFDRGLGVDDHDMNAGAPAIVDWQIGWRQRERQVQEDRAWAARELAHTLAQGCPP